MDHNFSPGGKNRPAFPGPARPWPPRLLRFLSLRSSLSAAALMASPFAWGQGQEPRYQVRFAGDHYTLAPGTALSTSIVIDPPPAAGLFSYGIVATVQGGDGLAGLIHLVPRPVFAFDSVRGEAAPVDASGESSANKGHVDFFSTAQPAHQEPAFAGLTLGPLPLGTWSLALALHNTLGPTEAVFVDGLCRPLDHLLDFGTATVEVAEPTEPPCPATTGLSIVLVPGDPGPGKDVLLSWKSLSGMGYRLQYSSDLATWKTIRHPFTGTGERLEWTDTGPPLTESHPSTVSKRFYRFITPDTPAEP